MNLLDVFDKDGTLQAARIGGSEPEPPCKQLAEELIALREVGHALAIVTGAPERTVLVTENQLGVEFDFVAHSHCTVLKDRRKGTTTALAPLEACLAINRLHPRLDEIIAKHGGRLDDKERGANISFFGPDTFEKARMEIEAVVSPEPHLRLLANPHDGGLAVLPTSVTKQTFVDWAKANGFDIGFGIGDSPADGPLLEAAQCPIVARTTAGGFHPPELLEIAKRKNGLIAEEHHGVGVAECLRVARTTDILRSAPNPNPVL